MKVLLRILSLLLLIAPFAQAQLEVSLKAARNTFIKGENPTLQLTVTNRTGRDIHLKSDGQNSWLHFKVTGRSGLPATPIKRELFRRVVVPRGKAISREITLGNYYSLNQDGSYSVRASVHLFDEGRVAHMSNAAHFNIVSATTAWSKRIGVPEGHEDAGHTLHFYVKRAMVDRSSRLFAEVIDESSGRRKLIMQLGQVLSTSAPTCLFDADHTFHVLFQNTGVLYVHSRIDIDGNYLGHDIYKRAETKPRLVLGPDEMAHIVGGRIHDPVAERQERNRIHRVSERPPFTFE